MKVDILCVGKIKEEFYVKAIKEYVKRLSSYVKLNIIEIKDEKVVNEVDSEIKIAIKKEGENILSKIKENSYVVTLEILGNQLSSEKLANKINNLAINGISFITFVIGGSYGLDDCVKNRANYALSFSKMTFPHQLMRVVLLEQIYRSYKIIKKEKYHK